MHPTSVVNDPKLLGYEIVTVDSVVGCWIQNLNKKKKKMDKKYPSFAVWLSSESHVCILGYKVAVSFCL